jgi:hypothetical protein
MADLNGTFAALRKLMRPFSGRLDVVTDEEGHLYLNTRHLQPNGKPLFFGAVQVKKSGVSYHLMPLYTHPALLRAMSPELKKRLAGKSCFSFGAVDPDVLKELATLTKAGFEEYRKAGYV